MRSMKWPPVISNGRLSLVEGAEATVQLVIMTLGDLSQNPFNPKNLSLGDVAFRVAKSARVKIEASLIRLQKVLVIQAITEVKRADGDMEIRIDFIDRETRQRGSTNIDVQQ